MSFYYYCPTCGFVEAFGDGECSYCGTPLIETDIECDLAEYCIEPEKYDKIVSDKYNITSNPKYNINLAKRRIKQQETENVNNTVLDPTLSQNNKVNCPYCKSTNVSKISTAGRVVSVGLFGLGSGKIGKEWHCNSCKSNF